ncbi:MAG: lytic transglycosylase domain-containing protein [Treponemataceae bacterium]
MIFIKKYIKSIKLQKLIFGFVFVFLLNACTNANELSTRLLEISKAKDFQKLEKLKTSELKKIVKLQNGDLYYLALQAVKCEKEELAKKFLNFATKNYLPPYDIISENLLLEISSLEEKIKFLEDKNKKEKNELKKLSKKKTLSAIETAKIEKLNASLKKTTNELDALFCEAFMFNKMSQSFESYCAENQLDKKLILSIEEYFSKNNNNEKINEVFFSLNLARILSSQKEYHKSAEIVLEVLKHLLNESQKTSQNTFAFLTRPIVSDFGKALLYGSSDFAISADILASVYAAYFSFCNNELLADTSNLDKNKKSVLHALTFYLARLYEKLDTNFSTQVLTYYELAQEFAPVPSDFDNALWYELKFLSRDEKTYLKKMKETAHLWKNPYWYEDLVSTLSLKFIQSKNIEKLRELQNIIQTTGLNEEKAKLAYAIGRLTNSNTEILKAYEIEQNNFYYKLMSGYFLNKSPNFKFSRQYARDSFEDLSYENAIQIIEGLFRYSFYEEVYPHIRKYAQIISVNDAERFAKQLSDAGFVPESMSLIQFALNSKDAKITPESLRLLYPRPFYEIVNRYAKEYDIPEYFLYALIRAESYFRSDVVSHAGAVGLAQLMPSTAKDIAHYFKLNSYKLTDPEINVRFGTYYLFIMIKSRGSLVKGCQAYNAGGGNVRRWTKLYPNISNDLFVESTPYDETRNYAKRILEYACHYANLYYNTSYEKVIKEFFNF